MANPIQELKACPVCGKPAGSYCVSVGDYSIFKCSACGLEYTTPVPSDEELGDFYQSYSDIRADVEVQRRNAERNCVFLRETGILDDSSSVLDFGCGAGIFADVIGPQCLGFDISAIDNGVSPNVTGNYEKMIERSYDVVTLWGVLEHLSDPVTSMQEIVPLIATGGHVVITTVNAESNIPYYYKPVEHLTYWTEMAIRHLFEIVGLSLKLIKPYEMEQSGDIYVNRLLSRTPPPYAKVLADSIKYLPAYVSVPTNEFICIAKKQ